ncbi:hypothetical protein CEUSTIGMA_g4106.t1 [Chlamydomonas eustigma]|uniref:Glycosyltransferase 2-like domain-containing protein n=1 Tax=Chlamydomonas eustigma TaxID=1157962 RepID=A0A250X1Q0_9CHLO|nr:hypothetical protein CEUSTIGMA_g4106.t1 [Chlamydomonas eustigma]|eukprot:GAX76660.1 hypothetical protein CEUSTIGMA_g4106.t1 [Chlamydomonas eustigma]
MIERPKSTSSSYIILSLLLSISCITATSPSQLRSVQYFLPYCSYLSVNLSSSNIATLRSLVQIRHYLQKRVRDLTDLIYNNEHPPTDPVVIHTFKTKRTIPELKADFDISTQNLTKIDDESEAVISQLRATHHLPHNATFSYVSHCLSSRLEPALYHGRPKVSFLLQYFKRPQMIDSFVTKLAGSMKKLGVAAELVVNVDNVEESQQWAELSYSTNGFVVPVLSNNVHEARAYNRIAGLARGQLLILLQDDMHPPEDDVWVQHLLQLFSKYPELGAVGMMAYRYCIPTHSNSYHNSLYFHDKELGIKAQFVAAADFAPLAVRKTVFEEVGGLDEGLSEEGVCGIFGDWDLVTRMWLSGWQVMYMDVDGLQVDSTSSGGTHKPETGDRCWLRQAKSAGTLFNSRFGSIHLDICEHVQQLNLKLLQVLNPAAPCPYTSCTLTAGA